MPALPRWKGLPMAGIPVLHAEGDCIARAWENALVKLYDAGCHIATQYDKPGDPPSRDATMVVTIHNPAAEPMIHRDFPGGFEELQEYVMEVCEGIKDHCIRDPDDADDTRWEYTYHQRLFGYDVPTLAPIDQIETICSKLVDTPHTRRAQAVTWKVWEDNACYDPACLQSIWCRVTQEAGRSVLNMNVRFRSNDAYKAAFMNIFALVALQQMIAARIAAKLGAEVSLGRYCHLADSFHIYGANLAEFEGRLLNAIDKRTFEQRTMHYADVRDLMEEARPAILAKARAMGRGEA
jgi:thymidylate synthase